MTETLTSARCERVLDGFRIAITPPESFRKVALEFLDGANADVELVLDSPAPAPGRCNWTTRDADGRPIENVRPADEVGMRKAKVYATLDPMTECSFLVRGAGGQDDVAFLSYVSIVLTKVDDEMWRLGFLRLQ